MKDGARGAEVVVSLGTDHHRFDRLVDWIDDWLETTDAPPSCLVQYGASRAPRLAAGVERLPRDELLALYRQASVVVVQGGPGSILDAREVGHLPLAVPRRPELNEVVDSHQIAFSETMARHGDALIVYSAEAMMNALDTALQHPQSVRTSPRRSAAAAAADKLAEAVERLEKISAGPIALRRIKQLLAQHRHLEVPATGSGAAARLIAGGNET